MQLKMFAEPEPPSVRLRDYEWVLLSSSAGKDSQAMIDYVYARAVEENYTKRLVIVHCDLGRVEWPGTRELAERQARHYGLRFEVVRRTQGDLLEHVESRGMWPSPKQRYCTSDHKRGQVSKVLTKLTGEVRRQERVHHFSLGRPVRILSCMGLRADESPARAKRPALIRNDAETNGRRIVDTWLPLHDWTEAQVWERIRASGVPHHHAYDLGMPRLSCCFCIFAPKSALALAGRHNPELLNEYVRVEERIGHKFRVDLSMADVRQAVQSGEAQAVTTWKM